MNLQWTHIAGFGLSAWHHDDRPLEIPFMVNHQKEMPTLVLHHHEVNIPAERIHLHHHHTDHSTGHPHKYVHRHEPRDTPY